MVPQEKLSRSSSACQPAISMVSRGLSVGMDSARRTSFPMGGLGGPTNGGGGIGFGVGGGTGRRGEGGATRDGASSLFFYLGGDGFRAGENFCSWVFLGKVFGPLGGGFGLGLREAKKATIPQEKKGSDEDESTNDESDKKIS